MLSPFGGGEWRGCGEMGRGGGGGGGVITFYNTIQYNFIAKCQCYYARNVSGCLAHSVIHSR